MAKRFPVHPRHPERICWGCDKYCPSNSLTCGNGSERTQHPVELFGEDWLDWCPDADRAQGSAAMALNHGSSPDASRSTASCAPAALD